MFIVKPCSNVLERFITLPSPSHHQYEGKELGLGLGHPPRKNTNKKEPRRNSKKNHQHVAWFAWRFSNERNTCPASVLAIFDSFHPHPHDISYYRSEHTITLIGLIPLLCLLKYECPSFKNSVVVMQSWRRRSMVPVSLLAQMAYGLWKPSTLLRQSF